MVDAHCHLNFHSFNKDYDNRDDCIVAADKHSLALMRQEIKEEL